MLEGGRRKVAHPALTTIARGGGGKKTHFKRTTADSQNISCEVLCGGGRQGGRKQTFPIPGREEIKKKRNLGLTVTGGEGAGFVKRKKKPGGTRGGTKKTYKKRPGGGENDNK